MAISNALMVEEVVEKGRMEEELAIARDLQTSMLPATCPAVEGFEIAAFSEAAREVGGDFYDFIPMSNGRLGIVIGDVTGKSVSGALVMAASRSVFRMLSQEGEGVGEIMALLKELGIDENTIVMFSSDNGPESYAYERVRRFEHRSMGPLRAN